MRSMKTRGDMKKVFVKQNDYELYSIPISLRSLSRRNGRNFLLRELEKRHPCFSSSNCFDTKVQMKHRNLFAEVVVMEKAKLFEYRNKFPSRRLFLEGHGNRCVFRKKEDFVKLGIVCVLLAGAAVGWHMGTKARLPVSGVEENRLLSPQAECAKEDYVFLAPHELFTLVFSSVSKNGGRINSMEWSGNVCEFDVSGCPSEEIAGAKYCQVSYKNGEPNFTIHNDGLKIRRAELSELSGYGGYDESHHGGLLAVGDSANSLWAYGKRPEGKNFVPAVRTGLLSAGCAILGEQVAEDSCSISFLCSGENFSSALGILAACSRAHGLREKSIRVENGAHYAAVKVSFSSGSSSTEDEAMTPLSVCAQYAPVLCRFNAPEEPQTRPSEKKAGAAVYTIAPHRRSMEGNRLGSIVAKDGRVFTYYKSNDGKIKMEEERAK